MVNENVKIALNQAGITAEQFAQIVDVDPKTVRRWVAGRTPYPRHRALIARALDIPEHELWPGRVPAPAGPARLADDPASLTGAELVETVGYWNDASDPAAPTIAEFIAAAHQRVDVLDGGSQVIRHTGVIAALSDRAAAGCPVRVIVSPTADPLAPDAVTRIAVRRARYGSAVAIVRADEQILFSIRLEGGPLPLLQISRGHDHGLYDRLLAHLDDAWQTGEQLGPVDDDTPAGNRPDARAPHDTDPQPSADRPPARPAPGGSPRRWPRS